MPAGTGTSRSPPPKERAARKRNELRNKAYNSSPAAGDAAFRTKGPK